MCACVCACVCVKYLKESYSEWDKTVYNLSNNNEIKNLNQIVLILYLNRNSPGIIFIFDTSKCITFILQMTIKNNCCPKNVHKIFLKHGCKKYSELFKLGIR